MNRSEMVEALNPEMVQTGQALVPARRRLVRMTTTALKRELLLRGLVEYADRVRGRCPRLRAPILGYCTGGASTLHGL